MKYRSTICLKKMRMGSLWISKARGKDNYTHGRGRTSSSRTFGSSYGSSSSSPIIQRGGMSLYDLSSRMQEKAYSIHLEDNPKSDPLHAQLQEIFTQSKIRDEPWKIFQRYLVNGLYFPGISFGVFIRHR
ncbi:hypothetical protein AABB24_012707 [Solanum stoloniferum]|uniref:Uncharacterized protein n=1 Tax=Solanum stoloniferum TaxID=62892 RepID=A0ABD2U453_9SOLN